MKYDLFISYNSQDNELIEKFSSKLLNHGMKVFLDKWSLEVGSSWQEGLETALQETKAIAIFIGENGFGKWQAEEMRSAIDIAVNDKSIKIIPIILPQAEFNSNKIPIFLRRYTWVDFSSGIDNKNEYTKLVSSLGIDLQYVVDNNIFLENEFLLKDFISVRKYIFSITPYAALSESLLAFIAYTSLLFSFLYFDILGGLLELNKEYIIYFSFSLGVIVYIVEKIKIRKQTNNLKKSLNKIGVDFKKSFNPNFLSSKPCEKCQLPFTEKKSNKLIIGWIIFKQMLMWLSFFVLYFLVLENVERNRDEALGNLGFLVITFLSFGFLIKVVEKIPIPIKMRYRCPMCEFEFKDMP